MHRCLVEMGRGPLMRVHVWSMMRARSRGVVQRLSSSRVGPANCYRDMDEKRLSTGSGIIIRIILFKLKWMNELLRQICTFKSYLSVKCIVRCLFGAFQGRRRLVVRSSCVNLTESEMRFEMLRVQTIKQQNLLI